MNTVPADYNPFEQITSIYWPIEMFKPDKKLILACGSAKDITDTAIKY